MKANNILETIGHTPHIRMNRLFGANHNVWIKSERSNPGGSIKDRIALSMIEDAEKSGILKPGGTIIEPTSGNTGIALAFVAAIKGYRLILTMPESMSLERRKLLKAYGAELVLTEAAKGMKGAIAKAEELAVEIKGGFILQQFSNQSNVEMHQRTTAEEIWKDTDCLKFLYNADSSLCNDNDKATYSPEIQYITHMYYSQYTYVNIRYDFNNINSSFNKDSLYHIIHDIGRFNFTSTQ